MCQLASLTWVCTDLTGAHEGQERASEPELEWLWATHVVLLIECLPCPVFYFL